MGKQLLKNMGKKAVKAKLKKKKVKGKDVAKKMMGKEDKGGALDVRPKADLVASPGGKIDLVKPKETGGEIVKVSGNAAAELGLTSFMESLTKIQTNVDAIKVAINDNNKDTIDRIEDQRLLNAKLKKEEREKELESKKSGIGQKLLKPLKDPADNFLARMAKFATMTLLGSLIAALMNGARDVILAFRIGIEVLKKGLPTLLKGVKALKAGIGKAFSLALRPFKSIGNLIFKGFKALGSKLFGFVKGAMKWVDDAIKLIINAGAKAFPKIANAINQGKTFAGNILNTGKSFIKNVGSKIKSFLPGGGAGSKILKHGLKRGANRLIIKWFGKGAAKTLMTVGKTLVKGAKAIKIPVIGPLLVAITSMFSGDPIGKTLFKTAGAAIGGGLGLALGPIGMIVGEIAGEFVGDVLHEGFIGKDGWAGAGKKLKDKFMQILSGGKKVMNWLGASFGRFYEGIPKLKIPDLPKDPPKWIPGFGFGSKEKIWNALKTGIKVLLGPASLLMGKEIPNVLWMINPKKTGDKFKLLKDSFFPPKEEGSVQGDLASIGEQSSSVDVESISSSASYEDGADEEPTVVIDEGGGQAAAPSQAGKGGLLVLPVDKSTIVNSQYEVLVKSKIYKS